MGYPMSWRRVISRNGLHEGDYASPPVGWQVHVNVREQDDAVDRVAAVRRERCLAYQRQASSLAGDLRRLEHDALDESAVCQSIVSKTGVAADDVAAVLQAFLRDV